MTRVRDAVERSWEREPRTALERGVTLALSAAEGLYASAVGFRDLCFRLGLLSVRALPVPVVSIGGLEVGGTGKTPLVLETARRLAARGLRPAIVSGGYGGDVRPARRITAREEDYPGDEPLWLARFSAEIPGCAGVWVGRPKRDTALLAVQAGARSVVIDDGFQHRGLARDLDLVSLSAARPLANGHLLPRGPLRERPIALRRADGVVLAGTNLEGPGSSALAPYLRGGSETLTWRARGTLLPCEGELPSPGERIGLLVGIGHPERVVALLGDLGWAPAELRRFPDHHAYRKEEILPLVESRRVDAWVTTEKDWVRLAPLGAVWRRLAIVRQTLEWNEREAEAVWDRWLSRLSSRGPDPRCGPVEPRA